jgi:1-acyl-sn-glycerol-3-phosphate acyltransferase
MAKSELFDDHGRLVRWFLYQMGAFPVHRNSGDMESVRHALNHLQNSEVVGIFPQGGCVRSDTLFQPKAGAALIAAKAQVPVLPACIYSHGPVRPFKRVTVRFGRVLSPEQLGFREGSLRESRNASKRIAREVTALLEERF